MFAFIASLFALPLVVTGCGHDEEGEAFDTLEACYEDHHGDEGLEVQQAIVVCCLEHPIAGVRPSCGDTAAACATHVTTELGEGIAAADIQAACATYINPEG
jgi:hypothetical protein